MARLRWPGEFAQDVRFAVRTLRKNPGFSLAAILTLGLGIGAMTAILSVVNGVVLRPLPYPNASRAVLVWGAARRSGAVAASAQPFSAANFVDLRAQNRTLQYTAAFRAWPLTHADGGQAELLSAAKVTAGLFEVLGVAPFLGRTFTDADDRFGAEPVVVLGHGLWRRRFGADLGVVGRTITLGETRYTVVGVMPPGFAFPRGAELPSAFRFGSRTDLWVPMALPPGMLQFRGTQNLVVIGLPRRGATTDAVRADLQLVMQGLAEQYPNFNPGLGARVDGLLEGPLARVGPALLVLLGAVGFLLLIACANVSNLLLTRTISRSREVAIRGALGAGRGRLVRQFVTENLTLAVAGGILGVLVAAAGKGALLALVPSDLPRRDDIAVDWRVLGVILALLGLVGVGLGALATSHLLAGDGIDDLRDGARGGGLPRRRLRSGLAVFEVAVSVILLVGATTLGRTFLNLRRVSPGFEPDGVVTGRLVLPSTSLDFRDFARLVPIWARFYRRLTDDLASTPGIGAAGVVTTLPLSGAWESTSFGIAGRPPAAPGELPNAFFAGVSEGYFRALRIPVLRGRLFASTDPDSTAAVVISEALARAYWPGQNPIGQRILPFLFSSNPSEIIGVVGDVRQTELGVPPPPVIYFPLSVYPAPSMTLVVRAAADPRGQLPAIRERIRTIDPTVPLTEVLTMNEVLAESLAQQRFSATLAGGFALAAFALAVLGLYGVVSFGVARRVREIGLRLALGAEPSAVLGLVIREGALLSVLGIGAGVVGSLALGRVLSRMVFGVSASDPLTLGAVAGLMAVVALAASFAPARRAMRVDPAVALRAD